jgi:hypothetical protein
MDPGLQQLLGSAGGMNMGGDAGGDQPSPDTSEQIYISSLALLKMLKHGKHTFHEKEIKIQLLYIIFSKNCLCFSQFCV